MCSKMSGVVSGGSSGELIGQAVAVLRAALAAPLPDSGVVALAEVDDAAALGSLVEAFIAPRLASAEAVDAAYVVGYSTTSGWVQDVCRSGPYRAGDRLVLARQWHRLPQVAAAVSAGEIGYEHAVVIARACASLPDALAGQAEQILVEQARTDLVVRVGRAASRIRAYVDPDGFLDERDRQHERRWFALSSALDGMVHVRGLLDAETAAKIQACLDPLAKPAGPEDTRTRDQRMADALDMFFSQHVDVHMSVLIPWDTLIGQSSEPALLPDGEPIPPQDARRMASHAWLGRVLLDAKGLPLDVGREERLATPAIRKALHVRDGHCVVEGCTIPAAWCEADHVVPWAHGGTTSLDNMTLCCPYHNKFKHRHPDRVHITRHPNGRITYRIVRPRPTWAAPAA